MIRVTRLNGTHVVLNALLIERIETTPDTVIRLTTGAQYVVKESADDVRDLAVDFLARIRDTEAPAAPVAQIARIIR